MIATIRRFRRFWLVFEQIKQRVAAVSRLNPTVLDFSGRFLEPPPPGQEPQKGGTRAARWCVSRPAEGCALRSHGPVGIASKLAAMAFNSDPHNSASAMRRESDGSVHARGCSMAIVSCATKKFVSTGQRCR